MWAISKLLEFLEALLKGDLKADPNTKEEATGKVDIRVCLMHHLSIIDTLPKEIVVLPAVVINITLISPVVKVMVIMVNLVMVMVAPQWSTGNNFRMFLILLARKKMNTRLTRLRQNTKYVWKSILAVNNSLVDLLHSQQHTPNYMIHVLHAIQ